MEPEKGLKDNRLLVGVVAGKLKVAGHIGQLEEHGVLLRKY